MAHFRGKLENSTTVNNMVDDNIRMSISAAHQKKKSVMESTYLLDWYPKICLSTLTLVQKRSDSLLILNEKIELIVII